MHAESLNAEQRNALLPIARIPSDTLLIIFSLLAADLKHSLIDAPSSYQLEDLSWVTVTHVCRYWRHVAIQNARLWADNLIVPFLFGKRWVPTFLSRAEQAPLTIYQLNVGPYDYPNPFDLEFILANLAHIRVLRLCLDDADLHALCTPAPLLEYFETSVRWPLNRLLNSAEALPPVLPHGLFGGAAGAPALRHLRLYGDSTMSWTSPLLAGLVSLEISTGASSGGRAAEIVDIVDALDRMPSLERLVLHLYQVSDNERVDVPPPRRVVALACLRDLDLATGTAAAALLLAHITLPTDATVHCTLDGQDVADPVPETAAILAAAATCLFHSAAASRLHLQLADVGSYIPIELKAWRSTDAYTDPPALSLRFHPHVDHYQEENVSAMVRTVLEALASEHLEELAVGGDGLVGTWVDALGRARRLRRLRVERAAACTLFTAPRGDLLPALSLLSIAGVDLRFGSGADVAMADGLVRYLEARVGAVVEGLAEVDVVACEVDDELVRRAREAVPGLVMRWRSEDGDGAEL
ncbi:hypothetical protein FA95DRAFT_624548 [Auriscalpium vulgare]|uniref:Uncharacterized protein n=1 Tax=Auriscalpium vulgare TaxID=40419 RepID=A0ACB8S3G6_9AGAM|nr:hypothetical protein FA95DRAFT_624548 [Auriscalpium vulgare]